MGYSHDVTRPMSVSLLIQRNNNLSRLGKSCKRKYIHKIPIDVYSMEKQKHSDENLA